MDKYIDKLKQEISDVMGSLAPPMSFASDETVIELHLKYVKKKQDKVDNKLEKITLYHASDKIVRSNDIKIPGPRNNCDFGRGFYLTNNKQTAEEWVNNKSESVINSYTFEAKKSDILHLDGEDWIRVVVGFRKGVFRVIFKSPVIRGFIADDRMDDSLAEFLQGNIGDRFTVNKKNIFTRRKIHRRLCSRRGLY